MEMHEGWKRKRQDLEIFYKKVNDSGVIYSQYTIDQMTMVDLLKEMAEALEITSKESHDHGSGVECSGCVGEEALKKFKEWK